MVTHKHDLCAASRGRGVCELHLFAARLDKHFYPANYMKKKLTIVQQPQLQRHDIYLMRIADLLSDDPILCDVIGPRFKVVAWADRARKRVTYSFRRFDDTEPDEVGIPEV